MGLGIPLYFRLAKWSLKAIGVQAGCRSATGPDNFDSLGLKECLDFVPVVTLNF